MAHTVNLWGEGVIITIIPSCNGAGTECGAITDPRDARLIPVVTRVVLETLEWTVYNLALSVE